MDDTFSNLDQCFSEGKPLDFSRDEKPSYFAPTATRAGGELTTLRSTVTRGNME